MQVWPVPHAQVPGAWLVALPYLKRMADSAEDLTLSELFEIVHTGRGELWLVGSEADGTHAALVTILVDMKGVTVAKVIGAASDDSREWFSVIPDFHRQLAERGATKLSSEGRGGWARRWPGARILRQVYEVDLNEQR